MLNWKKKIDDQEETEKRDRERREAKQKARQLAERKEQEERSRKEKETKIRTLGQQFQCRVCNKPATVPFEERRSEYPCSGGMETDWSVSTWSETNWSIPGDLWQCSKCNKWTCEEHIYKGICQKCAEKM